MYIQNFDLSQNIQIEATDLKFMPYRVNGVPCNRGELCEKALKVCLNAEEKLVRNNRPFYSSTDIEELKISIKSCKCTIPNLNNQVSDKKTLIDSYISHDIAELHAYCIFNFNAMALTVIYLTPGEFAKMLYDLGSYDKSRNVIRMYKADSTVLKWCMANGLK